MRRPDEDFYVGYLPSAPRRLGHFLRRAAGGLAIGAVAVAIVAALVQSKLAQATFEFGHTSTYRGTIATEPIPALRIALPGTHPDGERFTRIALVNKGKHGAQETVAHHANHEVQLEGTLVYRDGETMIEVAGPPLHIDGPDQVPPGPESLGTVTLRGEIVDAKCYLGVMNPGNTVVHRACTVRCLSGGIPPMLAVAASSGTGPSMVWLTAPGGSPLGRELFPFVAEPVEVTGHLRAYENHLVLEIDPGTIVRLR